MLWLSHDVAVGHTAKTPNENNNEEKHDDDATSGVAANKQRKGEFA